MTPADPERRSVSWYRREVARLSKLCNSQAQEIADLKAMLKPHETPWKMSKVKFRNGIAEEVRRADRVSLERMKYIHDLYREKILNTKLA